MGTQTRTMAEVAADHRLHAHQILAWQLDGLRVHAGLSRLADEDETPDRMFLCHCSAVSFAHFHPIVDVVETWEFEAADPDVGIFTESVWHACLGNLEDPEPAFLSDVTRSVRTSRSRLVDETSTFTCPVCERTTSVTDQIPRDYFEDVR